MNAAIALDLAIVLTLQFQRQAVQTAVKMELGPFQQLHILVSLIATLLYFPQLFFGWMLFQGRLQTLFYKTLHRRLGYTIFTFRTMGLILMFSMLKRH